MTTRRRWIGRTLVLGALFGEAATAHAQLAAGDPTDKFEFRGTFVTGATNATDIAPLPDGRAVVTLKGGTIWVRRKNGTVNNAAGSIMTAPLHSEQGLLGVVAHPDFSTNKTLFFYASAGDVPNKHRVYKGVLGDDDRVTVNPTAIVTMGLEGPANHNGGGLVIHKNHLYIGVGDTGSNATPPSNKYASCLNKPNGKILRVDLEGGVPADNPLSNVAQVTACNTPRGEWTTAAPDKRIWAWGLRNPWRLWIDPQTDLMWIGDVGESAFEEVSVGGKGTHFGYPFEEGTRKYNLFPMTCTDVKLAAANGPACAPPVHAYGRDDGRSITGGVIPVAACGWPAEYQNRYFFGDHATGRIWTLDVQGDRSGAVANSRKDFGRLGGNDSGPVSFRMGFDGTMYVVSHGEGSVATVIPKNRPATCAAAPMGGMGGSPATPDGGVAGMGAAGSMGAAGAGAAGSGVAGAGAAGSGAAGAAATAGRGGTSGGAGSGGSPGSPDAGAPAGDDSGGCSCTVPGSPRAPHALALLAGLAVAFGIARRRRRR